MKDFECTLEELKDARWVLESEGIESDQSSEYQMLLKLEIKKARRNKCLDS